MRRQLVWIFIGMLLALAACSKSDVGGGGSGTAGSNQLNWDQANWNEANWQ
jgi:hypothetical protein